MAKKKSPSMLNLLASAAPTVTATKFKDACAESLDAVVRTHQTLTVTKHGKPYVKVVPAQPAPLDPFGFMAGTIIARGDLMAPDEDAWEESERDPLARS